MLRANRSRDDALLRGFEPRFADAKAVRMRYFVAGEGRPVVLVHGLSGAAANWVHVAPRLAERNRVLIPDLPGHAGSGALPAAPNLDAFVERVRHVAELERMLPATIVGHSLGARGRRSSPGILDPTWRAFAAPRSSSGVHAIYRSRSRTRSSTRAACARRCARSPTAVTC